MKKFLKLTITFILALHMVLLCGVSAFADDPIAGTPELTVVNGPVYEVSAGKSNEVNVTIKNTSAYIANQIVVQAEIVDAANNPFTVSFKDNSNKISSISPRSERTFTLILDADKTASSQTYPLTIKYIFFNSDNIKYENSDTIYFKVQNFASEGNVYLENFTLEPGTLIAGGDAALSADIRNVGPVDMYSVIVSLSGLEPTGVSAKGEGSKRINQILAGTKGTVYFNLSAAAGMENGNYPVTVSVKYKDLNGTERSFEQIYYVNVTGGSGGAITVGGKPKIIVNEYKSNPMIVMAGEEFDLTMSFLNTHNTKAVKNIKMYLTMAEETSANNQGTGNVFTPVNSSNTFYFTSIEPGGTAQKKLRLYVVPDAQPKTYTLTVNFEYEDEAGAEYTSTELLGINVKQPTEIEIGDIYLPESIEVGMDNMLSFDIFNTGKVTLNNLMVKLEGDINTSTKSTYFGNFESGYSEYYEGSFSIMNEGENNVKVIISYDDPSGEHYEEVKEYTIMGMAPMPIDEGMIEKPGDFDKGPSGGLSTVKIILILGAVIVIAIAAVIILKKRKAKKQAALMMEDDDFEDDPKLSQEENMKGTGKHEEL